jgi:tRNA pseudouridine13 synthase
MYKIKSIPEDFCVREIAKVEVREKGDYAYFLMKKRSYTTQKAIEEIARSGKVKRSAVGYAGLKDKNAVTEQLISVAYGDGTLENVDFKDISLKFLGRGYLKIGIGDLDGNEFRIVARNLDSSDIIKISNKFLDEELKEEFELSEKSAKVLVDEIKSSILRKKIFFPNYFDEQRFSKSNCDVARHFLKREFAAAVMEMLKFDIPAEKVDDNWKKWDALLGMTNNHLEAPILEHLKNNQNDFVGALRTLPRRIIKIYIGSLQSRIFNDALSSLISSTFPDFSEETYSRGIFAFPKKGIFSDSGESIPLVGFGSDIFSEEGIPKIVSDTLKKDGISQRDFIVKEMPELSSEGSERKAFCELENLNVEEFGKDELNEGRYKIIFSFYLKKGSYATIALRALFI